VSAGRCAGCGGTDSSCQRIKKHVQKCPDFLALYRTDPARALDPEAEYRRWVAEDRRDEAAQRRRAVIEEAESSRAQRASRFATPPDVLEEDEGDSDASRIVAQRGDPVRA
jgi:hypothetical protein